jgi:hypothetical protein
MARWRLGVGVLVVVAAVIGNLAICRSQSEALEPSTRTNRPTTGIVGHGPITANRPDTPDKHHGSLRLEGQVIDETDRPVAEATVAMHDPADLSTTTEADGSFVSGQ